MYRKRRVEAATNSKAPQPRPGRLVVLLAMCCLGFASYEHPSTYSTAGRSPTR